MKAHADEWDVTRYASALQNRSVLFISATNRDEQDELVGAMRKAKASRLTALNWDTDHSFSDKRLALARTVAQWLKTSCRF